ncbi:MFS transporter [candidate division KSB1 bacterium]|nr:MFS transporter [candidate division KSB1 bacterium]
MSETTSLTWKFSRQYWIANTIELFERAAYYGMFIALTLFLSREVGFNDIETGWVAAIFAATLYLAPTFNGAIADKLGFRPALILAFSLLTFGYGLLGALPTKFFSIMALSFIMLGGAFVKPVISGTVARYSDETNRARAFSIFYQIVNIGAFLGKGVARPLRTELGLRYINFYAAGMALLALAIVLVWYHPEKAALSNRKLREIWQGLLKVVANTRFMALILIVAGFWAIQGQLYATMPKYSLRLIGESAAPEWLANINPLVVVLLVIPITHLVRKLRPVASISLALAIIPFSALTVALSPLLTRYTGSSVNFGGLFSLHPITITLIIGIALQGLAECFLSPRFYEYASRQAPKGQEGLYMGYSQLTTFFAWLFGFASSGYLLDRYCPDPKTLTPAQLPGAYDQAHYIWYFFAGVGIVAFLLINLYRWRTDYLDRTRGNLPKTDAANSN